MHNCTFWRYRLHYRMVFLTGVLLSMLLTVEGQSPDTSLQRRRTKWVIAANIAGYGTTMIGLYQSWYSQYPQSSFHSFNDWNEWKQVDKVGHIYSSYIESMASMELWRWARMERKKRIWIGGLSGMMYQTTIEILDGFSKQWGWSWGDIGANIIGSGALIAQELAWNDQRIKLKFSFHRMNYLDPELERRSDDLFGKTTLERMLKDYNGQTYWASISLHSFFPKSTLPSWLNLAAGYGANGLFGGRENKAMDAGGNIIFNRPDIERTRQWYLSPDIDWKKIPTKKKGVRFLFTVLSAFKMPAPALQFTKGKWKVLPLYF